MAPVPAETLLTRGKSGWKWSLLCDRSGIPVGWSADGANRHDQVLFAPTLDAAADRGLLADVETLHLDRGYDSGTVRACAADRGIDDVHLRPPTTTRGHRPTQNHHPTRDAMARRTHQLVAVELRTTPPATPTGTPNTDSPNSPSPSSY